MLDGKSDEHIFDRHIQNSDDLKAFLNHAIRKEVSDVFIQAGKQIRGQVHGRLVFLTRYSIQVDQMNLLLRLVIGSDEIRTALAAQRDYDAAFSIPDETETDSHGVAKKHRFRLNATAVFNVGADGGQIVLRHIPSEPPLLSAIGFPEHLIPEFTLQQGAFIIAGETGSGKTTTFAGCIRYVLTNDTPIKGNIVTYESPVEYLFTGIESDHCIIAQSEIPRHLPTFEDGVRNAMRRKPALVVIGEMRDAETIQAAVEASNTGHPVFGTVHASHSGMIIQRMVQRYPSYAQHQAFTDIVQINRLLMSQTLVPRVGGGRVCLRDWVIITPERQEELLAAGYEGHAKLMKQWMQNGDHAQDMLTTISKEFIAGNIDEVTRDEALKRYGGVVTTRS